MNRVFAIRATSSSIDKNRLIGNGGVYPYVTRSDANNGINDWITAQPAYAMDEGNCITVGFDTQTAFYQPAPTFRQRKTAIIHIIAVRTAELRASRILAAMTP